MTERSPDGLGAGGRKIWHEITDKYPDLDIAQLTQLEEACRAKDRLDRLDKILRGDVATWAEFTPVDADGRVYEVRINHALEQANKTANLLKQLFAALRLPDPKTGKRPQYRGPRGAQLPTVHAAEQGKVSSLERARARLGGDPSGW